VASAGPYANLHLDPDRSPLQHSTTQFSFRPDPLFAAQPTVSKHCRNLLVWVKLQTIASWCFFHMVNVVYRLTAAEPKFCRPEPRKPAFLMESLTRHGLLAAMDDQQPSHELPARYFIGLYIIFCTASANIICKYFGCLNYFTLSALTLLVWRQEVHLAHKKPVPHIPKAHLWKRQQQQQQQPFYGSVEFVRENPGEPVLMEEMKNKNNGSTKWHWLI